jgi:hypothetical protein
MADDLKVDDRVILIRSGEKGTVTRVDGYLVHAILDSNLRLITVTASLKRIENENDPRDTPTSDLVP